MNRRQLLKVGAASMVVIGAGLTSYGVTRRPNRALEPWTNGAHAYGDPRLQALSYAILSPNPHNRQPWVATLVGEREIALTCDLGRRLPETDPFDRQITIGLGCFLETLSMAAKENGYRADISYFPDGEPGARLDTRPVAHIAFTPDPEVEQDSLFEFVKQRRSNKKPYDTSRRIPRPDFGKLLATGRATVSLGGTLDTNQIEAFRDLTWRAHKVETYTPRTMQESIDLMRIGKAEIEANPDGIDLGGFPLELFAELGFVDREQMADQSSTAFEQGLEIYRELMFSAMGYVWVITPDNSRVSQLEAGRTWMRLNLRATKADIALHPLSQALQEYPEMAAIYAEIHEKLEVAAPSRIQMFGRIGYGPTIGPSPRWAMETRIKRVP